MAKTSLRNWVRSGWLKPHRTSKAEIADLLGVAERDLADCRVAGLTSDREAEEMVELAVAMRTEVMHWLQRDHPELI